jgi:ABC-2 type transport system permease protein
VSALVIARRELYALFLSPMAWAVLAVVTFILGWIFLVQVDAFMVVQSRLPSLEGAPGLTDLVAAPLFGTGAGVVLLIMPLLTMRLFAEERRSGTFDLLQSSPVSTLAIVLGKYLALLGFLALVLALIAAMPLSLLVGGALDGGQLAAGLLGVALMLASFAAVGLFISSLTAQPGVAAVLTYGVLLFFLIVQAAAKGEQDGGGLFEWLSMQAHFAHLLEGLVRTGDLVFYVLLTAAALTLCVRRLELMRTEG